MKKACPHLLMDPGDLPEFVFLPGDPKRAQRIAERFDEVEPIAANREYHSYRGTYRGVSVSVVSAGVGSAGAAIAYEESIRAGARTLIRIGSAGSIHDSVHTGDLVVVFAAVRAEGTSRQLVPIEVPAVADPDVTEALWMSARASGHRTHRGVGVTLDAFYQGVLDLKLNTYSRSGAICVEMENATLFTIGRMRGMRTGSIVAIDGDARSAAAGDHDPHCDRVREAIDREIDVALDAVVRLADARQT
jgi:uridine phosphorylase